jgi:hypothetical protein
MVQIKRSKSWLAAAAFGCWIAGQAGAARAAVEAFAGAPFGVGRVTMAVSSDGPVIPLEDERFTVAAADGRVLYPVVKEEPVRRLLRRILEIESPVSVTVYFLFRGDEPFDLQAYAPSGRTIRVVPQANPRAHRELLNQWWQQYSGRWASLRQDPQFPPVVENFLAVNLARRMGLRLPEPGSRWRDLLGGKATVWDELFATERRLLDVDRALLTDAAGAAAAREPLPPPMPWYDLEPAGEDLAGVDVEPMALHVPAEAFYVRFGAFANYLWMRDMNKKWQGDLGNMLLRRAIDRAGNKRIEQQLSLKESMLSRVVGPQVINDVAVIGLDPYVAQGGAVGILFHAKNSQLLALDLTKQRREALTNFPAAKESTVRIADRDVSLIATPGGEVRSYYVADGDFHLVTTSARLAQRFIQAGQGDQPLAASNGFLRARRQLGLERNDAIFAYISPEFIRQLTSPAVWIESQRRARAARAPKVLALARMQAAAEGLGGWTPAELVERGVLPEGWGARAEGGELVELEPGPEGSDAAFSDSLRGAPGYFLPVSEVEVAAVTAAEAAAYREFSNRFRQQVGQTPPIAVAIQRTPLADKSGETMSVDVLATPLKDVKLGRLPDMLGDPSPERLAPIEGDLIRVEAVVEALLPFANAEPHHLFLALRDHASPLVVERGQLAPGAAPAELVRAYWGAWPRPGVLQLFSGGQLPEGPEPIAGPNDSWQAKRDDFLLMSFKPEVVNEVLPRLEIAPADPPAQAWIEVADLTGTELSGAVNALGYARARETTVAACRLMNTLANQLHLPREACRAEAERLMDGAFVCPLGGEYVLADVPNGLPMWTSTALTPNNRFLLTAPPDDFQLTLLTWFKGLRGHGRLDGEAITLHVEVDMAESATP